MKILVLNSGSSSLKYQLIESETEEVLAKGLAERIGLTDGALMYETSTNGKKQILTDMADHDVAMEPGLQSAYRSRRWGDIRYIRDCRGRT